MRLAKQQNRYYPLQDAFLGLNVCEQRCQKCNTHASLNIYVCVFNMFTSLTQPQSKVNVNKLIK